MDNYTIDKCFLCGDYKPLKNGICIDCLKVNDVESDIPDFFRDLFKKKEK